MKLWILLAVIVALSGCASTPSPRTCAIIGGLGGGAAGAAGGAVRADHHDDWEGAAIGVGGLAVGAGVGYLVCHLLQPEPEPRLEPAPAPKPEPKPVAKPTPAPAPAVADPCENVTRLSGVNFDNDRAVIRPDAAAVLDGVASQLARCARKRIKVEAFTDSSGPADYNMALSQRRADAVRQYLVGAGISAARIDAVGFGEDRPIATNGTREGRAKNRRVELRPID